MRTLSPVLTALSVLALVVASLAQPGCAGNRARDNVLVPALGEISPGLRSDVAAGVETLDPIEQEAASEDVAVFFEALGMNDRNAVIVRAVPLWPAIETLALRGIDAKLAAGEIGPGVRESLLERVRNMEAALTRVAERGVAD